MALIVNPPRTIIIGAASGGGAVVLIALAMIIFIVYDRKKKRRRRELASFDGSRMFQSSNEKGFQRSNLAETSRIRTGSVVDPAYTSVPLEPVNHGNTTPIQTPVDNVPTLPYGRLQSPDPNQQSPQSGHHQGRPSIALSETRNVDPQTNYEADRLSYTSLDIEGMLNMAMQQSAEGRSREGSIPMVLFGGSQEYSANPAISSSAVLPSPSPEFVGGGGRRLLKVNSDIPAGPLSATESRFSFMSNSNTNPFSPADSVVEQAGRRLYQPSPRSSGLPSRTPGGSMALPTSPRVVRLAPGRASIAESSARDSSSEWYGVGIAR